MSYSRRFKGKGRKKEENGKKGFGIGQEMCNKHHQDTLLRYKQSILGGNLKEVNDI